MDLLWMGVGSGISGSVGGIMNQFTGTTLSSNVASGLAGGLLTMFSNGIPKKIGKGLLIKSIGDFVEENVAPSISSMFKSSSYGTIKTPSSGLVI